MIPTGNHGDIMVAATAGWQTVTTRADGKTLTDRRDSWGRIHYHQDLGDNQFYYQYNQAGWLSRQKGDAADDLGHTQDISYVYYNNGLLKRVMDTASNRSTRYEYDANGNRVLEGISDLNDNDALSNTEYYQVTRSEYDAMNRVTKLTDPRYTVDYKYDANGNRINIHATYDYFLDVLLGENSQLPQPEVQDYWYAYDSMNRFTTTMGTLDNGEVVRGTTGYDITYYADGNRATSTRDYGNTTDDTSNKTYRETYSYTDAGYLASTLIERKATGTTDSFVQQFNTVRTVNDAGQTLQYTVYGDNNAIINQTYTTYNADSLKLREDVKYTEGSQTVDNTVFTYYANSNELQQTLYKDYRDDVVNANVTETLTEYQYDYWDSAKQRQIDISRTFNDVTHTQPDGDPGQSLFKYDANGHLIQVSDTKADRYLRYNVDQQGKVLTRNQYTTGLFQNRDASRNYYYFNDVGVGDVGDDGSAAKDYAQILTAKQTAQNGKQLKPVTSADFDQNYQAITEDYPGNVPGSYSVRVDGETLASIAQNLWGDSSLWYILADANGLTGTETLTAGFVLTVPNVVTNIHNNSSVFRPYNPGQAIGNTMPTLPDPPAPFLYDGRMDKGKLRANIRTLENLKRASLLGEEGEKSLKQMRADLHTLEHQKKGGGCGGAMIIVAIVAAVVTAGVAGVIANAATVAAGGTAVSGLGATIGLGFSALAGNVAAFGFGGAFLAGAAGSVAGQLAGNALGVQDGFSFKAVAMAGLTAGVGAQFGGVGSSLASTLGATGTVANAIVGAGINNAVIGQGLNIVTGQQHGFNWRSMAASAIAGGVNYGIRNSNLFSGATTPLGQAGQYFASNATQSAVRQGVGVLVKERDRISWSSVASDALSNTAVAGLSGQFTPHQTIKPNSAAAQLGPHPDEVAFHRGQRDVLPSTRSYPLASQPRAMGVDIAGDSRTTLNSHGTGSLYSGFDGFGLNLDVSGLSLSHNDYFTSGFELAYQQNHLTDGAFSDGTYSFYGNDKNVYLERLKSNVSDAWGSAKYAITHPKESVSAIQHGLVQTIVDYGLFSNDVDLALRGDSSARARLYERGENVGNSIYNAYELAVGDDWNQQQIALADLTTAGAGAAIGFGVGKAFNWTLGFVPNSASNLSRSTLEVPTGLNPLDPKKLELWQSYLGKRGVNFEIGTSRANQVLQQENALGVFEKSLVDIDTNTFNRTIYLRENFNRSEFYEEAFHALDDLKGLPTKDIVNGRTILVNELRAKESLLNIQQSRLNNNRIPLLEYEEFLKLEYDLDLVRQGRY